MGYYTDYSLNVECDFKTARYIELVKEIDRMNVFDVPLFNGSTYSDGAYWYDWEDDMLHLSLKFPEFLFELHGEGEDKEDMWDAYIQNGAIQVCHAEITYPPYDPGKMQKIRHSVDLNYEYSYA